MVALADAYPGVQVRLVEAEPEPALEALRSHALDLVVADEWAGTPRPRVPGVDREDLFAEPVMVALPAGHPARPRADRWRWRSSPARRGRPATPAAAWPTLVRRVCNGHGGFEPTSAITRTSSRCCSHSSRAADAVTLLPQLAFAGVTDGVAVRPSRAPS